MGAWKHASGPVRGASGGMMPVRTEVSDKWVRAYVDDVAVVDSREALLFWEEHFPVPA